MQLDPFMMLAQSSNDSTVAVVDRVLRDDVLIPTFMFVGVVLIVGMNVIGGVIKRVAKERTRREIAAFIAEGSMTPEQGERLMRAGESSKSG